MCFNAKKKKQILLVNYLHPQNRPYNQHGLNKNVKISHTNWLLLFHFVENQYCVQPKYVINPKTEVIFHCGISVQGTADSANHFPLRSNESIQAQLYFTEHVIILWQNQWHVLTFNEVARQAQNLNWLKSKGWRLQYSYTGSLGQSERRSKSSSRPLKMKMKMKMMRGHYSTRSVYSTEPPRKPQHCQPKFYSSTPLVTHSMEQKPSWEADSSSASEEIPRIYGTRGSITAFMTVRHLYLSRAR